MIEMHVCYAGDVIEGAPAAQPELEFDLRDEAMALWSLSQFAISRHRRPWKKLINAETLLYYACEVPSTRRRIPVNVEEMIAKWKATIIVLCTAHEKDDIDKAEFEMDELLKPMLTAPVAELRAFYAGLLKALESDKQVPFFIWKMFRSWGEIVLEKSDDKDVPPRKLRRRLAKEVAHLAMTSQTRKDMIEALVGALQWRSPEALKQMRDDLEGGAKPRVKGRESCIFLVTERKGRELHTVML